jgi:hypothetical protein
MAHLGGVLIVKTLSDYSFARAKVIQMVRDLIGYKFLYFVELFLICLILGI